MTPKERISAVFAGETPDKIPVCHIGTCSSVASALLGREAFVGGGIQRWREVKSLWEGEDAHAEFVERSYRDAVDVSLALDNDMIRPSYWRCNRKPSRKIDEYTYVLGQGPERNWSVLRFDEPTEQCALTPYLPPDELRLDDIEKDIEASEKTIEDYRPSVVADEFALRAMDELGDKYVIRVGGVGIGIPHSEVWMEALALRPDLVARHLDVQTERAVRNVQPLVDRGFKHLFGGYDFASNDGPMFSPALFNRLLVPRLKRISAACERAGARHLFASDGNLWPVAEGLFGESGVHGYYEIDRSAGMDLTRLRTEYPELTLLGNIASQTVHLGTVDDVVRQTEDCLEVAREHGRVVVGTSNYFVPGTPPENVAKMVEVIRERR